MGKRGGEDCLGKSCLDEILEVEGVLAIGKAAVQHERALRHGGSLSGGWRHEPGGEPRGMNQEPQEVRGASPRCALNHIHTEGPTGLNKNPEGLKARWWHGPICGSRVKEKGLDGGVGGLGGGTGQDEW